MRTRTALAVLLAIGLLASASLVAGCQSAAEKATEAMVEGATGVSVDEDGDKVTIEGEDGSVEIQSGQDLPEDFPGDAPVYDADIESSGRIGVEGTTSWTVTQTTGDSFEDVTAYFAEELASSGWTESGNTQSESDGSKVAFIGASKGTLQFALTVQQDEGSDTDIAITVNEGE
jgi:hypothetical protein